MVYFDNQNQIPNDFNSNFYTTEYNYIPQIGKKNDVLSVSLLQKNIQNILRHIYPIVIYNTTNVSLLLKNYFPISLNKRMFFTTIYH